MYKVVIQTEGGSKDDGEYTVKCIDTIDFCNKYKRSEEDGLYCYDKGRPTRLIFKRKALPC